MCMPRMIRKAAFPLFPHKSAAEIRLTSPPILLPMWGLSDLRWRCFFARSDRENWIKPMPGFMSMVFPLIVTFVPFQNLINGSHPQKAIPQLALDARRTMGMQNFYTIGGCRD